MRMSKLENIKTRSRSNENSDAICKLEHTIEYAKYIPHEYSKPILRACGCVHRFSISNDKNKSLSGYKRRSKSCTSSRNSNDTQDTRQLCIKASTTPNGSLSRYTSEKNLYSGQSVKIEEEFEIKPFSSSKKYKFHSTVSWEPRITPRRYMTTMYIDLDSSARQFEENISMEMQMIPWHTEVISMQKYGDTVETILKQTLPAPSFKI